MKTIVSEREGRAWLAAGVLCAGLGLAFALLPYLAWRGEMGRTFYVADQDDLLYLSIATPAFHHHPWTLSDPATASMRRAVIYDWVQFVPGILLAKAAGGDIFAVNLAWRALAGLGIGVAWLALFGRAVRRPWLAAALAVMMLSDCGAFTARPLVKQVGVSAHLARGKPFAGERLLTGESPDYFATVPGIHRQWRIITPALSHAFLLVQVALWMRAREEPTAGRVAASGLGFGLLFYVYFYNWMAVGLALALGTMIDAGRRRVAWISGAIGCAAGLPRVIERYRVKEGTSGDWAIRSDLFLPIPRFSELMLPAFGLLLLAPLLAWVWWRRRDLLPVGLLAVAAVVLLNHQVASGLQIQNTHWIFVFGSSVSALLLCLIADRLQRGNSRRRWWAVGAFVAAWAGIGLGLRWEEAVRSGDTREIAAAFRPYQAQRLSPGTARLEPVSLIAGEKAFVDLAVVAEDQRPLFSYAVRLSPSVDDEELLARQALNEYLRGLGRSEFDEEARRAIRHNPWGPWARDRKAFEERVRRTLAAYDRIVADPGAALGRFPVRYVALRAGSPPPRTKGAWSRIQEGPTWDVWERRS